MIIWLLTLLNFDAAEAALEVLLVIFFDINWPATVRATVVHAVVSKLPFAPECLARHACTEALLCFLGSGSRCVYRVTFGRDRQVRRGCLRKLQRTITGRDLLVDTMGRLVNCLERNCVRAAKQIGAAAARNLHFLLPETWCRNG